MKIKNSGSYKTVFTLITLFFAFLASATKIALVPLVPELNDLSDQVLAAIPKDCGIEFVERIGIEDILKEHKLAIAGLSGMDCVKLNKTVHADLFAIITARIVRREIKPAGLIIYNARNGFRLVNVALSEKDTVKNIVRRLCQASEQNKYPEKQTLVSIVTVRDAGVPEHFKYMIAFTAAELERRLGNIPNVIVLERDYLGNINREREITGQMFKLAPSAHLLRLEFSPTDSFKKVALTIKRTNVSGEKQVSYKVNDAFSSPDSTLNSIIAELEKQLNLKFTNKLKNKSNAKLRRAEARRFYYEHLFLMQYGDYAAARRKLQTVIALSPNQPKYRMARLPLIFKSIVKRPSRRDFDFKKQFGKAEEAFQTCDEVHRDFPKYKKRIYSNPNCIGILLRMLDVWRCANNDERKIMVEFANNIRPQIENELLRSYKFNLDDGINSIAELEEYRKFLFRSCAFHYYFDSTKYINTLLARGVKILQLSSDFFSKNPELIPQDINRQYEIIAYDFGFPRNKRSVHHFALSTGNYIKSARKHPFKAAKCIAYSLELCHKTALSDYDVTIFRKNLEEYFRIIDSMHISHIPKNIRTPNSCTNYEYFLISNRRLSLLKISKQIAAAKLQSVSPFEKLLQDVANEKNLDLFAQKVTAVIPQFKKLRPQIFTDRTLSYYPDILANKLYYGTRKNNINCQKALDQLMDGTKITPMLSLEQFLPSGSDLDYSRINSSCWFNGMIYLLVRTRTNTDRDYSSLKLFKLDPTTGKTKEINRINGLPRYVYPKDTHGRYIFSVSDKYAFLGLNGTLFLLPLDGSSVRELKDFPGETIQAVSMLDSRIYVFTGKTHNRRGYSQGNLMISCLTNGSDRKIHMSTLREEKQNFLDKNPSVNSYAFTDAARKRIIFTANTASRKTCGLWEFYPKSGKFNKLLAGSGHDTANKIGNNIFFISMNAYYNFDCRNDNVEKEFGINCTEKFKTSIKTTAPSRRGLSPLFLIHGNHQCIASESRLLMFFPGKIKQAPFIFLPGGKEYPEPMRYRQSKNYLKPFTIMNLFPHPDGKSVIVVGHEDIYKVTLNSTKAE